MTPDEIKMNIAEAARRVEAVWRNLMSPCEAGRIGEMTLRVMAHEAARAIVAAEEQRDG